MVSYQDRLLFELAELERIATTPEQLRELVELIQWTKIKFALQLRSRRVPLHNVHCYRGEIYWAHLGFNIGSEQNKRRPVLILQNNRGNLASTTTIIAPITSPTTDNGVPRKVHSFEVKIHLTKPDPHHPSSGIDLVKGIIQLQQVRVISKSRLEKKICDLNDSTLLARHPEIPALLARVAQACSHVLEI